MMTLHSAKGLEFPIVFLVGMEEGLFPHMRTLSSPEEMEEERRLCYVGITRAKHSVFLTRAQTRMLYGEIQTNRPSRFLAEIPEALLEARKKTVVKSTLQQQYAKGKAKPPTGKLSPLRQPVAQTRPSVATSTAGNVEWKANDKASHGKWGVGTVVAVKGTGEDQEVSIAFPGQGIKVLSVKFAPIQRI